ncbi:hypothetical protein EWM64_g945 [Hericium alpestre]|uniref:BTB domain-containing protein n=1 Tax=Hericium alpestre TaxID=135208 RepID=A0A4Z0AA00_9AGAM|nr:hypothetical protein EWM64_g945 [Hericium alpestre]
MFSFVAPYRISCHIRSSFSKLGLEDKEVLIRDRIFTSTRHPHQLYSSSAPTRIIVRPARTVNMMSDLPDNLPHSLSIQEPRAADTPFNNKAADVILRTSDKVDFYVYKAILSLASPVFESMFSLPQPASASDASLGDGPTASHPVIDVSEDSRTMDSVLHFCYPVRRPSMTKLVDVGPVLLAAFKYEMNVVLAVARIALEQCIDQDTLGAFALALRCELYDVCSKAAKQFAQHPFLSLDSKELDHIKADRYRQLLKYHDSFARDSNFVVPPEAWSNRCENVLLDFS